MFPHFATPNRSAHFGVHDLNTNKTSVHLEGMGGGVEMIAFDWMTKNLFWTDSEQNWVMVSLRIDNFVGIHILIVIVISSYFNSNCKNKFWVIIKF